MTAKEFRLGNWFNTSYDEITIEGITHSQIYDGILFHEIDDIRGIYITEDWLKEFHLTKVEDDPEYLIKYSFARAEYGITLHPDGEEHPVTLDGKLITCVTYVHELQNLYFALTFDELTTD